MPLTGMLFNPRYLAIWDVDTGKKIKHYTPEEIDGISLEYHPERSHVERLSWSPKGDVLAFTDRRGRILFLDISSGNLEKFYFSSDPICQENIRALTKGCVPSSQSIPQWSLNGEMIAFSWQLNNDVRIHDWAILSMDRKEMVYKQSSYATQECFSWSPDSRYFATIDDKNHTQLSVHDIFEGKLYSASDVRDGFVTYDCQFISDKQIAVGSGPTEIINIDGNLLRSFMGLGREPIYLGNNQWLWHEDDNIYVSFE
jgi:WD40 repeat protein